MLAPCEYRNGNCGAAVPDFEKAVTLLESQPGAQRAFDACLTGNRRLRA
jgi:hypothetical protein